MLDRQARHGPGSGSATRLIQDRDLWDHAIPWHHLLIFHFRSALDGKVADLFNASENRETITHVIVIMKQTSLPDKFHVKVGTNC